MALITCPDCGSDVSDAAPACPHCGHPVRAQVIESTGKPYKAMKAVAVALFFIGALIWMASPGTGGWGVAVLVMGVVLYIGGRFGAWWNHG